MEKIVRKPLGNFLIMRSLQLRIILNIVLAMVAMLVVTLLVLGYLYNVKSQSGSFFYMSNDTKQDLELTSILGVILPALISAQIVSFLIAVMVGLFSSRKVAVPIYKIEKWANQLKNGNLNTNLFFREKEEMKGLMLECNGVTSIYSTIFNEIDASVKEIEKNTLNSPKASENIEKLREILSKIEYR